MIKFNYKGEIMKKFFAEFKAFISRGNIMDMAIGVIIGAAFGKIVTSLVNDILMPLVTWGLGAESLSALSVVLRRNAEGVATLTWNYGNFIQTIIDFLIIAFCSFVIMKIIMKSQQALRNLNNEFQKSNPTKAQKKILKERGINLKDKHAVRAALEALVAEEKAKKDAELANQPKVETQEDILRDIRELLKAQQVVPTTDDTTTEQEK